jgi:hypothetical protein
METLIDIKEYIKENFWWIITYHNIILVPTFGLLARNISIFFWFISMILLLFHFIPKENIKIRIKKYYVFFVFLCTISLFSPIDIEFAPNWKDSKQFITILPIVSMYSGTWQPIRNMQADNKIAYKDYVPNTLVGAVLVRPKYAIVIFYPSQNSPAEFYMNKQFFE